MRDFISIADIDRGKMTELFELATVCRAGHQGGGIQVVDFPVR